MSILDFAELQSEKCYFCFARNISELRSSILAAHLCAARKLYFCKASLGQVERCVSMAASSSAANKTVPHPTMMSSAIFAKRSAA
jgi:hypothetical protein